MAAHQPQTYHTMGSPATTASSPLLPRYSQAVAEDAHNSTPSAPPLSSVQRFAVKSFSILRILRGLAFLVYPALGLTAFDIPRTGPTFLLGALLGSRDLLLGGLLLTAEISSTTAIDSNSSYSSRREVRRALTVSLVSDVADTCILVFSAAFGTWVWQNPLFAIASAAIIALLEHLTLFSISEDDNERERASGNGPCGNGAMGYQKMLQASEDKKHRLATWMTEMRQAEEVRNTAGSPAYGA